MPFAETPSGAPAPLWGACPWSEDVTDYDRRNMALYARLLHDAWHGAGEDELARAVFRLDPSRHRARARAVVQSHLKRAHWIADTLFSLLDL